MLQLPAKKVPFETFVMKYFIPTVTPSLARLGIQEDASPKTTVERYLLRDYQRLLYYSYRYTYRSEFVRSYPFTVPYVYPHTYPYTQVSPYPQEIPIDGYHDQVPIHPKLKSLRIFHIKWHVVNFFSVCEVYDPFAREPDLLALFDYWEHYYYHKYYFHGLVHPFEKRSWQAILRRLPDKENPYKSKTKKYKPKWPHRCKNPVDEDEEDGNRSDNS